MISKKFIKYLNSKKKKKNFISLRYSRFTIKINLFLFLFYF
jgi:hypothetical protein